VALRLSGTGAAGAEDAKRDPTGARWVCALVNNMPDSAFASTERQFSDLLTAGAGPERVELRRYTMEGVPWDDLRDLLTWGRENVPSMLLSCLAAHAALLVFDGLTRTRLPAKCTGVFRQDVDPGHRLVSCVGRPVVLPHSRLNTVPLDAVRAAGYEVALSSEITDWAVASKFMDGSEVVVVQGHPEYGPPSLLLEYQRDVRRYVNREREGLPVLPLHCVSDQDWGNLQKLQARLVQGERDPALLETFPFQDAAARADWRWRDTAVKLYANWMAGAQSIRR
jgi:homoserine O-succinyltransferase